MNVIKGRTIFTLLFLMCCPLMRKYCYKYLVLHNPLLTVWIHTYISSAAVVFPSGFLTKMWTTVFINISNEHEAFFCQVSKKLTGSAVFSLSFFTITLL